MVAETVAEDRDHFIQQHNRDPQANARVAETVAEDRDHLLQQHYQELRAYTIVAETVAENIDHSYQELQTHDHLDVIFRTSLSSPRSSFSTSLESERVQEAGEETHLLGVESGLESLQIILTDPAPHLLASTPPLAERADTAEGGPLSTERPACAVVEGGPLSTQGPVCAGFDPLGRQDPLPRNPSDYRLDPDLELRFRALRPLDRQWFVAESSYDPESGCSVNMDSRVTTLLKFLYTLGQQIWQALLPYLMIISEEFEKIRLCRHFTLPKFTPSPEHSHKHRTGRGKAELPLSHEWLLPVQDDVVLKDQDISAVVSRTSQAFVYYKNKLLAAQARKPVQATPADLV
eukprot:gene3806-13876_t